MLSRIIDHIVAFWLRHILLVTPPTCTHRYVYTRNRVRVYYLWYTQLVTLESAIAYNIVLFYRLTSSHLLRVTMATH